MTSKIIVAIAAAVLSLAAPVDVEAQWPPSDSQIEEAINTGWEGISAASCTGARPRSAAGGTPLPIRYSATRADKRGHG